MKPTVTLRDLISVVSEFADNENEIVATLVHLLSSGQVRLLGESWADALSESSRNIVT